jgi:hypothetical protein
MSFRRAAQDIATVALITGAGAYGIDLPSAGRYLQLAINRMSAVFHRSGLHLTNTMCARPR